MKRFNGIIVFVLVLFIAGITVLNLVYRLGGNSADKIYNIEANRLIALYNSNGSITESDIAACRSITHAEITLLYDRNPQFFSGESYLIRPLYDDGELAGYIRFDYINPDVRAAAFLVWANVILCGMLFFLIGILLYVKSAVIKPMFVFESIPEQLSKGDFTAAVPEQKSRFFGRFLWGLDRLRETLEKEQTKNLSLTKEKSKTVLALSHDIKTPLSAITLCSKALQEGIYADTAKQQELLLKIDERTSEIQSLVQKLQEGASVEMLDLPVVIDEFYLDEVISRVDNAYRWRTDLAGTVFEIAPYDNLLLSGDSGRVYEALCNLLENAMKYGDGKRIGIAFGREEGCQLISVTSTGCSLAPAESVHIFDSFWRGSNSQGKPGNGLGLYIAKHLMMKMGGDAFAEIGENTITVNLVMKPV